jgi:hypothetical protein
MEGVNVKTKDTPVASSILLSRHTTDSESFDKSFQYRHVVGMLGYLETTRSDISYAVHQCARFVQDPKVKHGKAVRWLARYLKGSKKRQGNYFPAENGPWT